MDRSRKSELTQRVAVNTQLLKNADELRKGLYHASGGLYGLLWKRVDEVYNEIEAELKATEHQLAEMEKQS